jgi:8-oxo-dGTP diphosphatase
MTLEPLAARLGVEIEIERRLDEGGDGAGAFDVAHELLPAHAAVCSHGDVIPDLLHVLTTRGAHLLGAAQWPKGSTWEVRWDGTVPRSVIYHPPPG